MRKTHKRKTKTMIHPETGERISRKAYRQKRKAERRMMKDNDER